MKKKIVAIVLCIAMLAIALVGSTLAYFTDSKAVTNTMTVGSVKIEQLEQERAKDNEGNFTSTLQDFTPNKQVVPAVGSVAWAAEKITVNGVEMQVFDDAQFKNVIDKIVSVKNVGKSSAYIRTIIAIEAPDYDPANLIGINYNDNTTVAMSSPVTVTVDGVDYVCFTFTYKDALAAGTSSEPSLMQVYLSSEATQEDAAAYGETWEIVALSQAVQADGFADAATALNEAFGEANATNIATWIAE